MGFLDNKIKTVAAEFELFKEENNIDTYFERNLNDETRKRLLRQIEEFTRDQSSEPSEDKFKFDTLDQDTNARSILEEIVLEYNNYRKAKIEIIETSIHREWVEITPENPFIMPVLEYKQEFKNTLERDVIQRSVDRTKEVATEFLKRVL